MCFLQFSSCFYCFRRKGSSKQYVLGKAPLQLVTQLYLVFIAVFSLSKLRPRDSCGLKVASVFFQLLLNMPSNSCCPLSDCPNNKPVLLERMLPWVWHEGKKANPEKLAGHRWNLSSSCQEVLQDSASGEPVAYQRVVLQWHILASAYPSTIKKIKLTHLRTKHGLPPHTHLELFYYYYYYFPWRTKKTLLCTWAWDII